MQLDHFNWQKGMIIIYIYHLSCLYIYILFTLESKVQDGVFLIFFFSESLLIFIFWTGHIVCVFGKCKFFSILYRKIRYQHKVHIFHALVDQLKNKYKYKFDYEAKQKVNKWKGIFRMLRNDIQEMDPVDWCDTLGLLVYIRNSGTAFQLYNSTGETFQFEYLWSCVPRCNL